MITLLESGDRSLSPKWLHLLAEAPETSPGALLDYAPADDRATLLAAWAAIPESGRGIAMEIMRTFDR